MDPESFKDELDQCQLLAPLRDALAGEVPMPVAEQIDHSWQVLHAQMRNLSGPASGTLPMKTSLRRPPTLAWGSLIAFGVIAMAIMGGAYMHMFTRMGGRDTMTPLRIYHTAAGQQLTVPLADQSVMTLAPGTTVQVRPTAISISGEAYFKIAPHTARALTVQTANAVVRVLGTTFTVRQYPDDRKSQVVVEDGKVTLALFTKHGSSQTPVVLSAHTLGFVTDSTVVVRSGIAASDYTAWIHGRLMFDEVPLGDIITALTRAYGAEIRVADTTLAKAPMTMTVLVDSESLAHVLDFLTPAANAHYTRVGRAFVIAPGRMSVRIPRGIPFSHSETVYGK